MCGDDGGYSIMARTLEGVKVEILVKPYEEEDGDDDEGADVEEEDDADEE